MSTVPLYSDPSALLGRRYGYFGGIVEVVHARRIPGGTVADVDFVGDLPAAWCDCWAIPPRRATVCASDLHVIDGRAAQTTEKTPMKNETIRSAIHAQGSFGLGILAGDQGRTMRVWFCGAKKLDAQARATHQPCAHRTRDAARDCQRRRKEVQA